MDYSGDNKLDIREALDFLRPSDLNYQQWVTVGMGLKESGYSLELWDRWSQTDSRYHGGECEKKWNGFRGASPPVTAGTVVQMALDAGWRPREGNGCELDWDGVIGTREALVVVNQNWIEGREVQPPDDSWDPAHELITYIDTLFESNDNVGFVTRSWEREGKFIPQKGCWNRTAGQLISELQECGGDIGAVLGDYNPDCGAWIRFNPLDGNGIKNENVTDFRFALVESDELEIEKQYAILHELELPVATLVHSGKKSLHAVVRVDASSYEEYRKRVDYLYTVCQKNGLKIDPQNRNPSRLSRMPGVMRGSNKQYLLATCIGKATWNEWKEWIESATDDLPEPESMAEVWENLPELSAPLIDGVLRQGHKLLIAGPSKAGKSYALIQLCCSFAEGRPWLGFNCARGRVLYVNLELDRASCLHRFRDVYNALGWTPDHLSNIDVWNLRGRSVPMDKLAPKLIRRATKKNYTAIIIDPIYKVITGDENSADQMAHFCNQFDKVCTELGCAVIYCHHHSKGSQGGKRSMDRASGSGVFARDPDALLDLIELEPTEAIWLQRENNAVGALCLQRLATHGLEDEASQDDVCSQKRMLEHCKRLLGEPEYRVLQTEVQQVKEAVRARTAWRVDGTLREFPRFKPLNLWFEYPVHRVDATGALGDIDPDSTAAPWKKAMGRRKPKEAKESDRKTSIETAFSACNLDGKVTLSDLSAYMGVTEKTVRNRLKEHGSFWIDEGNVGKKT